MAKTILAFDESDKALGSFFLACKVNLEEFFEKGAILTTQLNSSRLNDLAIQFATADHASFIFGAYSHGGNDCLVQAAKTPYISMELNGMCFKNSFFYTFSCLAGKELGENLVHKAGCICFIGYKESVAIWSTFIQPFVETANYGLFQFFSGHNTIDIVQQMKAKYNHEIDLLYKQDFLIASILRENRDALTFHGNGVVIDQFHH